MDNEIFDVDALTRDLIAYTVVNSPTYKAPENGYYELDDVQKAYVQGLIDRNSPGKLCETLGISRVQPYLWKKKNKLFAETVELIENIKADDLEDSMWNEALAENANPIIKMFLIKKAKPAYRDNATPQGTNSVNIRVSVAGQEFKVVADATPFDETEI